MKTSITLLGLITLGSTSLLLGCSEEAPNPGTGGTGTGGVVVPSAGGSGVGGASTGGGDATGGADASGGSTSNLIFDGTGTWVDGTANLVGIQGAFFILEDSVKDGAPVSDSLTHTDFTADTGAVEDPVSEFSEETVMPCISGTAAVVTTADGMECDPAGSNCAWDSLWGGGIGLNLNESGGDDSVQSTWDATANGVTGFEFTLTGDVAGATLRFKAVDAGKEGEDFCAEISVGPNTQVLLDDLKHMCWGADGTLTLDKTNLSQVQWQVVTDPASDHAVTNLCIASISTF